MDTEVPSQGIPVDYLNFYFRTGCLPRRWFIPGGTTRCQGSSRGHLLVTKPVGTFVTGVTEVDIPLWDWTPPSPYLNTPVRPTGTWVFLARTL